MLRCREVTHLVATGDVESASFVRRLELRLHLMMCRHCRNYVRQIAVIGEAARRLWGRDAADTEEESRLETRVLRSLRMDGQSPPGAGPVHPPSP